MTLDDVTRRALSRYLSDVRQLPNESAKTHRFSALVSELFPGSSASTELAAGVEKLVRIDTAAGGTRRGFVDAYHGNAVIEFENSLKATGAHALDQLREYTSGLWNAEGKGNRRPLVCIASDGITWQTFRPTTSTTNARVTPDDIELQELRVLVLTEDKLADFWLWLTSLLFRPSRTEPSTEHVRVDFGATSPAFADALESLARAWAAVGDTPEPRLAFDTWQRYLTVTYGQLADQKTDDLLRLFLKHTYLASLARLLIWASLSKGKTTTTLRETAKDILSGQFFEEQRIENLVEDDFFQWVRRPKAEKLLAPVWERTLSQLESYDLAHLNQDIFKGVYQELVDPKDRHDLGEYYTPDWLCERVVTQLLPTKGFVSVLDPSCGSGSFLRATIAHLLEANTDDRDATRLRQILENVVGIDIHPLAVIISRATYLLAIRSLVKASRRPIQIPVYLADSLFLPAEVKQFTLGEVPGYEIRFGGNRKVSIPEELVKRPEFFDPAITAAARIAMDHAASGKESRKSIEAYLQKVVPELTAHAAARSMIDAIWKFTTELSDLIRLKQNSIWAFIVRNSYRPAMLRERFDFILGNPPWLSYRYIADPEYQAEIKKRAVEDYAIAPTHQKLFTQMELATIFLVHTLSTFARQGGQLGFVMPLSVVAADQHQNLRSRQYKAPIRLTSYWDLRAVFPVFNVPSCVLFATKEREHPRPVQTYSLPAIEWEGTLPRRDLSWKDAEPFLSSKKATARLIYLGDRNALSTKKGRTSPNQPSRYEKNFHQGATILPRSFYFIRVNNGNGKIDPDHLYNVETDPNQAEDAKPPYDTVKMRGRVEGRFIFSTALSRHLLPFAVVDPAPIILPCDINGAVMTVLTTDELRNRGYREFANWMHEAEKLWNAARKQKAESQTLYERLDYHAGLTCQSLSARYLTLYNAAGTNISAAVLDRHSLAMPFVVEHKLYWAAFDTAEEAHYLAAVLNSNVPNDKIKPFQSLGLMGERDIEKKVMELPIPTFNQELAEHQNLAALSAVAHRQAEKFIEATELPASLAKRRGMVRKAIADSIREIDTIVEELLSDRVNV
ncbi:MAG: N-6 DNA methylase [Rhizomicrobium sp.]|jgi:type I restriction-modification system DNA methylase subunit